MRKFIYLIGTTDDFESLEDLKACYFSGDHNFSDYNASVFPVEISESCRVVGYDTIEEIATMIARGEAFSSGWCMDDTLSTLLEA